MTEIFNLHTLCRCCHSDGSFKSLQLFYTYDNRIEVYSTMLKETLDVTIPPPPFEASYTICDCCIGKLRDAASFKRQVLECEQKFEEYCKNEQATVKEEIDNDSSNECDLDRNKREVDDENHEKNVDEECDGNVIQFRDIGQDEIEVFEPEYDDEKHRVKIKEENEAKPLTHIGESISIENVTANKKRAMVSKGISQSNGVKASIMEKNRADDQIDPELDEHVKRDDGGIYTCGMCNKKYKLLKVLRVHILKQHKDSYACQFCSFLCVGRDQYLRHSKSHANENFKCRFCGKLFNTKFSLRQHVNAHTKIEKFQCDMCHKFFVSKQTLKRHILWHFGANKTCMCDVCGHAFNDITNLMKHIKTVHEKQRPFECPHCPKTFTAKKHLKQHTFFHTGEKPYKCDICVDKFVSFWKLKYHQMKHHPKSSDAAQTKKLFTCKICKLEVASRGKFMSHLKTHAGQKDYKCHLCMKDFTCKYSLNRHITEHSGVKAFCCDACDKRFTQRSQMLRHKKNIHDPESKSYPGRKIVRVKCDICNKSFKDIEKHMESHKTRPHVCEICLKSYPERSTLNRHVLFVHHRVRRHPCSLCDKKYTKWSYLHKHTKKVHKLELKKEADES